MDRTCVVGLFDIEDGVREIYNKLINLGFEERDVSLVFGEEFKVRKYTTTLGPFRDVSTVTFRHKASHLGFSADDAREFESYLNTGGSVIAVFCDEDQVNGIIDFMSQFGASDIKVSENL